MHLQPERLYFLFAICLGIINGDRSDRKTIKSYNFIQVKPPFMVVELKREHMAV